MYYVVYTQTYHIHRKHKGRPDTDGRHLGASSHGQMPTVSGIGNLGVTLTVIVSGSSTMTSEGSATNLTSASALAWQKNSRFKLVARLYEQMGFRIEILSASSFQPCISNASISVLATAGVTPCKIRTRLAHVSGPKSQALKFSPSLPSTFD